MKKDATQGLWARIVSKRGADDSGISIIEVLAATIIFMLLFVGIAQGLVTVIRLSSDQKHRITALSLAASEIDKVRSFGSVFDIEETETDVTPDTADGTTYVVSRQITWVDSAGNDVSCGGASGTKLAMLRVNIGVTWRGQMAPLQPVQTDTLVAPNGSLNNPNTGVLILAVKGADGFGIKGVSVGLTASGTVSGTVPVPSETDDNGCSYAIGVPVGNYKITLTKDGTYVDLDGQPEPILMVGDDTSAHTYKFNAGTTKSLTAFIAKGALYSVKWDTGDALLNADLNGTLPLRPWVFVGTKKITLVPQSSTTTKTITFPGNPLRLYPDSAGYSVVYGEYSEPNQAGQFGCKSPNPKNWVAGSGLKAGVVDVVPGDSTAASTMRVGVGVVHVKLTSTATQLTSSVNTTAIPAPKVAVTATMQGSGGNQNPGCVVTMTLATSQLAAANNEFDLVLPYGAWSLSLSNPDATVWRTGTSSSNYKRWYYAYSATFTQVTRGSLSSGTNLVLDPRLP
jgi:hypothetical protein